MSDRGAANNAAKSILDRREATAQDNALWRMAEWFPDAKSQTLDVLHAYHSELLKFNLRLNLIGRGTERDADEAHFADCFQACLLVSSKGVGGAVYDVGSGNGLPGVIMSILNPNLKVVLVESDSRKCEFLKHAVAVLGLKSASVMNVRLETIQVDANSTAITRGFASLAKTLLACNKVFQKGARFYHLKGASWSREVADIPSQVISVWRPELLGEYSLPLTQARRAVIVTTKIS